MPILSQLSRRFHMLTTDAKPDPPRTGSYMHNLSIPEDEEPAKAHNDVSQSTSMPVTPEKEQDDVTPSVQKQRSNDARPTTPTDFCTKSEDLGDARSTSESKEPKRPRTKTKPKYSKYSQGASIVNYNIINSNGVKIGSRTSYICNVNQYPANNAPQSESASKPKYRPMPENVENLSTCEEELGFDDMLVIKTHVGHGWRDIARRLSYSDGQIDQFEENYRHKGIDEVIYQLLLDWKQANTRDAQLGMLVRLLWSCQEYDCVERLASTRKNSS
ncbi:immune deficiency isoform X2 [Cardiocondyla obscurior]